MGYRKLKLFGSVIIVVTSIIVMISLGDFKNIRREIFFRYHSKLDCDFFLGFIPDRYYDDYSEEIIEDNQIFKLIDITDLKFPSEKHNYIVLIDKKDSNSEEIILDSDSFFMNADNIYNLLSSQINKSSFNKILEHYIGTKKAKTIEGLYFDFIADFDSTNYITITSYSQINKLRHLELDSKSETEKCYKLHNKNIKYNFNNYKYVWFKDLGLFEFRFDIINNKIRAVKDTFIFGPLSMSVIGTEKCLDSIN